MFVFIIDQLHKPISYMHTTSSYLSAKKSLASFILLLFIPGNVLGQKIVDFTFHGPIKDIEICATIMPAISFLETTSSSISLELFIVAF